MPSNLGGSSKIDEQGLSRLLKDYTEDIESLITKLLSMGSYCRSSGSQQSLQQIQVMVCRLEM